MDIWKEALERANFKSTVRGARNLGLVNADGARLPILSGDIDLIGSNCGIWMAPTMLNHPLTKAGFLKG